MGLCKNCRWWKVDKERKELRLGTCYNRKWLEGYSYTDDKIPDDGILVENDEGWGCVMGPKFGCIHFQPR